MAATSQALEFSGVGAWPIRIALAFTEKAYLSFMKQLGIAAPIKFPGSENGAAAVLCNNPSGFDVVLICMDLADLKETLRGKQILSMLVHEGVHAWQYTKAAAGEEKPGMETEAYFIQHLTEWLFEECDKAWRLV